MQPPVVVPHVDDVPTVSEAVADEADLGRATVTLWPLVSWRPTRQFERAAARRFLRFGGNLACAGSAVVFRLRAWRELRSLASTYFGRPATT